MSTTPPDSTPLPDKVRQAIREAAEELSARCKSWAESQIYPNADWIEEAFTRAVAPLWSAPAPSQGKGEPAPAGSEPDGTVGTLLTMPANLNGHTRRLVKDFAQALAEKLAKAEEKYGYSDGWMERGWIEDGQCAQRLLDHAAKGDPRDVAAYCAFLWWHKASTKTASPEPSALAVKAAEELRSFIRGNESIDLAWRIEACSMLGRLDRTFSPVAGNTQAGTTDTERLNAVINNKWTVQFNQRFDCWTVQRFDQVVGCVAKGQDTRSAIDAAMQREDKKEGV